MHKKLHLIFVLCLTFSALLAQNAKEFAKNYENAIDQFKNGDYARAELSFGALIKDHPKNEFAMEARYFQAMCYYKSGNSNKATQAFFQLLNTYPTWDRTEDIYYMLGNIAFDAGDYSGAMEYLASCKSDRINGEAFNMKKYYLNQVNDFDVLKALNKIYPDDEALAIVLANRLTERNFLWKEEQFLLEYLMQTFVFDKELRKKIDELENRGKKKNYNVAVLFPFNTEELTKYNPRNQNQFVIDIYNGLALATNELDSLAESDVTIKLQAYDTRNDTSELIRILGLPELQNADMIYGPIYKNENAIVQEFCEANKVMKINPLSKTPIPQDSAFGLYFEPSMTDLGYRAAEFCYDSLAREKVFIAGYNSSKDSAYISAFTERFQALGGKDVKVRYYNKFDQILTKLMEEKIDTANTKAFITYNGNSKIVSNICSYYTVQRLAIPILVTNDFVRSNQFLPTSFIYTSLYSVQADWYNEQREKEFFDKFLSTYHYPPSSNCYIGYEMGWFFGKQLIENGRYFGNVLSVKESNTEGKLQPYFNYYQSNSNSFVPIVRMMDYQMIPVNFSETNENDE